MKIEYEVPLELEPYLSIIPQRKLCQMISEAIWLIIKNRSSNFTKQEEESKEDIVERIAALIGSATTPSVAKIARTPPPAPVYNFEVEKKAAPEISEEEIEGKVQDFLDDIFK